MVDYSIRNNFKSPEVLVRALAVAAGCHRPYGPTFIALLNAGIDTRVLAMGDRHKITTLVVEALDQANGNGKRAAMGAFMDSKVSLSECLHILGETNSSSSIFLTKTFKFLAFSKAATLPQLISLIIAIAIVLNSLSYLCK